MKQQTRWLTFILKSEDGRVCLAHSRGKMWINPDNKDSRLLHNKLSCDVEWEWAKLLVSSLDTLRGYSLVGVVHPLPDFLDKQKVDWVTQEQHPDTNYVVRHGDIELSKEPWIRGKDS